MRKGDKQYWDLDFQGYKSIAMACDNGATLPLLPTEGQWFLHTPAGRKILMQYVTGAWNPIYSFGNATIYVDVLGTNAPDQGGGTGASAFLTMTYAMSLMPPFGFGNLAVLVGAGTFVEQFVIGAKFFANITVSGTLTSADTGVSTGIVKGISQTRGVLTDSTKAWVVDEHKGKILNPGDGNYRLIYSNDATNLYLVVPMATTPVVGTAYTIYNYGTVFQNTSSFGSHTLSSNNVNSTITYIKFTGTTASAALTTSNPGSITSMNYCAIEPDSTKNCFYFRASSYQLVAHCYLTTSNANLSPTQNESFMSFQGSIFYEKTKAKTKYAFQYAPPAALILVTGCTFEGWLVAVQTKGMFRQDYTSTSFGTAFFIDNLIAVELLVGGSITYGLTQPVYSGTGRGVLHNWNVGEIVFSKQNTDGLPVVTITQGLQAQNVKAQTATIGETKTDVQGDGRRIYNVVHTTEGMNAPSYPVMGDIWIDTN